MKISTTLTVAGLTSGRVPYATTAGLLTDSANWLYDGTNWSMLNGNVAISGGSKINLNGSATSASGWSIRQSVKGVSFRAEGFFDYCYINGNGVFANLCGMHMGSGYKLTFDDGAGAYYIGRVAANNNIRIARAEGTGFAGAVDISQGYMSPVSGTAMALGAWTLGWSGLYLDESGAGTQTTLIRARTLNADNIVEPPTIDAGLVGSVNVNTTAVSNGNVSTVVDLQTWSMPASTLATDGDWVRIRAHFSTAANADLKTVYVYFGSTVVYQSNSAAYTAAEIDVEVLVVRTGATTQISTSRASADTTLLTTASTYATPAETLSSAVTIKTAGSRDSGTGNNNITSRILVVEWGGKDA